MQFRNITLQEQFFPGLLQEQLLKKEMAQSSFDNLLVANTSMSLHEHTGPMYVNGFLQHLRAFWPAYIVLGLVGYAMWRKLSKKEIE